MNDNAATDNDRRDRSWQAMLAAQRYAAEAIRDRRPILDTRRHTEALADSERVGFTVRDEIEYHIVIDTAELDETAPGWRDALAAPEDCRAEGYWDLIDAVHEHMTERNEIATAQWIALAPADDASDD